MKVIGSGFGRTGTKSLKQALEEIGFGPCYHMEEVIKRPSHIASWHKVARGYPIDWLALFADFQASGDFPASTVYKELMAIYPEAKVIHTVRDPERWYDSTYETIYQARAIFPKWLRQTFPLFQQFIELQDSLFWNTIFEGQFENRQRMIEIFHEYTADVQRTVPAERLLIFRVADGWEPLCQFLDVPVPNRPFPHVNDKATIQRRIQVMRTISKLAPTTLVGLVLYIAYRLMKTRL